MRQRNSGTTLLELLIALTILTIVAVLVVPMFLDALHRSKQKRTLGEMKMTGSGMMSWLTDEVSAAAAGLTVDIKDLQQVEHGALTGMLVPTYIQTVPLEDGWGHPYDYYVENDLASAALGFEGATLAIRSRGRDGQPDGRYYDPGAFAPGDYNRDLIWADGFFVRWPGSEAADGCNQGVGQGGEGCDPGNSNNNGPSNDESPGSGPGNPGKKK